MFPGFKEIVGLYAPVEVTLLEVLEKISNKYRFLQTVNKWLPLFTNAYLGEPIELMVYPLNTTRCYKCDMTTGVMTFENRLNARWKILGCGHIENISDGVREIKSLKDFIDEDPDKNREILALMDMYQYGWIKICEYKIPKLFVRTVYIHDIIMAILHLFFYYYRDPIKFDFNNIQIELIGPYISIKLKRIQTSQKYVFELQHSRALF